MGYKRTIRRVSQGDICVVRAVIDHLLQSSDLLQDWPVVAWDASPPIEPGAAAARVVRQPHVAALLKRCGAALGEDPALFGSHSLRIGGATALYSKGVRESYIQWWGNWRLPVFLIYCHIAASASHNFADLLAAADVVIHSDTLDLHALRHEGATGPRRGGA